MTIREFRNNLAKYLKALKDGEVLQVGKIWIQTSEAPGEFQPKAEKWAKPIKELKDNTLLSKHAKNCKCLMCKPNKK